MKKTIRLSLSDIILQIEEMVNRQTGIKYSNIRTVVQNEVEQIIVELELNESEPLSQINEDKLYSILTGVKK